MATRMEKSCRHWLCSVSADGLSIRLFTLSLAMYPPPPPPPQPQFGSPACCASRKKAALGCRRSWTLLAAARPAGYSKLLQSLTDGRREQPARSVQITHGITINPSHVGPKGPIPRITENEMSFSKLLPLLIVLLHTARVLFIRAQIPP